MNRKQKGFSLIELLIVVAIILIIAAIAIPNLLRARMAANESSAAGSLRSINTANATFLSTYGHSFAPTLAALGGAAPAAGAVAPCTAANLIDQTLGQDPATARAAGVPSPTLQVRLTPATLARAARRSAIRLSATPFRPLRSRSAVPAAVLSSRTRRA